jgi:hypothetical protein
MRKKIDYIIYKLQHHFGIQPKWEVRLRSTDNKLRTFYTESKCFRNDGWVCEHYHNLYHNRINYLKGWIKEL